MNWPCTAWKLISVVLTFCLIFNFINFSEILMVYWIPPPKQKKKEKKKKKRAISQDIEVEPFMDAICVNQLGFFSFRIQAVTSRGGSRFCCSSGITVWKTVRDQRYIFLPAALHLLCFQRKGAQFNGLTFLSQQLRSHCHFEGLPTSSAATETFGFRSPGCMNPAYYILISIS